MGLTPQLASADTIHTLPRKGSDLTLGSERSNPLSTLLLITLLAVVAVMLIVPAVDPPDTAFQGNTAPLVVHSVFHHVAPGNQHSRALPYQLQASESAGITCARPSQSSDLILPFEAYRILRC